ncbi:short-chain dehydrogenase/reductase [Xylariaceae sp. AK1471]|nr:short-chain dehydrogenase/reductase [Xylariaceae sp. AK1471]
MSDPYTITAHETRPDGPPADLHLQSQTTKLRWAVKHPPSDPKISFAGKTVLVTGANTGLGFEAAVKYAALGASRLILAVRTAAKGEDAKTRIVQRTGCDSNIITVLTVDLTSFDSVQAFIVNLKKIVNKLDIALLNAGLGNPSYEKSPSGWEMAVQVNVLSTALMGVLLLPLLRSGTKPHLTFVNSSGHDLVKREWIDQSGSLLKVANKEEGWDATRSYSMVKLLGMSVMQAIARAINAPSQKEIVVNAVCPGLCKTDLGRNFGLASRVMASVFTYMYARTAEQGARSLVSATALGPESHGRFWHLDVLYPIGDLAKDKEFMKEAWVEIWDVISQGRPELEKILEGAR